jgi:hypothetical protein
MTPHDEEERSSIEEQLQDYSDLLAEERNRQLVNDLEKEIDSTAVTPPEFRPWLRRFLETQINTDRFAFSADGRTFSTEDFFLRDFFLRDLRNGGFICAVVWNINEDDADSKERRRGAMNRLPDDSIAWPVIQYVLDNDNSGLRDLACKWVTDYAPDCETAVAVLTKALRRKCPIAALQLSRLAPDTPGLVDVLAVALGYEWIASNRSSYDYRLGGAGEAALALARLGTTARPALARLRAAVLSPRDDFHAAEDRRMAFDAYAAIADDAEIQTLLDEMAAKPWIFGEVPSKVFSVDQEAGAVIIKDYRDFIASMRVPEGWKELPQTHSDQRAMWKFAVSGDMQAVFCLFSLGIPVGPQDAYNLCFLLTVPSHTLQPGELQSVGRIFRHDPEGTAFRIESAHTKDMGQRRILFLEGTWIQDGLRMLRIFVPRGPGGTIIEEIYFLAPPDKYALYREAVDAVLQSIEWIQDLSDPDA